MSREGIPMLSGILQMSQMESSQATDWCSVGQGPLPPGPGPPPLTRPSTSSSLLTSPGPPRTSESQSVHSPSPSVSQISVATLLFRQVSARNSAGFAAPSSAFTLTLDTSNKPYLSHIL